MYYLWLHLSYNGEGEYLWQRPIVWCFKKKFVDFWFRTTQGRGMYVTLLKLSKAPSQPCAALLLSPYSLSFPLYCDCLLLVRARSVPCASLLHLQSLHSDLLIKRCPTHLLNGWALKFSHQSLAWESSCLSSIFFPWKWNVMRTTGDEGYSEGSFSVEAWKELQKTRDIPSALGTVGRGLSSQSPQASGLQWLEYKDHFLCVLWCEKGWKVLTWNWALVRDGPVIGLSN